ncbi:MAG: ribosome rescue protein RqcH [Candidatus Hydrothermarchaeaceae archaeon]
MKDRMSSFDILALLKELKELKGSRINKVFQISPVELRVQLNAPGRGKFDTVIVAGRRMHLTERPKPAPKEPSTFAMTLRKYLGNAIIEAVEQVSFDRIVVLKCRKGSVFFLIVELFGNGNVILSDEGYNIISLLKVERFKDRELLPKRKYALPPGRSNPFECGEDELVGVINNSGTDLVRALARELGLGGLYAEEVCLRSGLAKDKKIITRKDSTVIKKTLLGLLESLDEKKPRIVFEDGKPIDVVPLTLEGYGGRAVEEFDTFNNALDEYFSILEQRDGIAEVKEDFGTELGRLEARLKEQEALIEKYADAEKRYRAFGDFIYSRFSEIEGLLAGLTKAREKYSWEELMEALKTGEPEIPGAGLVSKVLPREGVVVLKIDGKEMRLDFRKSAAANADHFYTRSKKSREKIRGAGEPMEETRRLIKAVKEEGVRALGKVGKPEKRVKRKRQWFEKFRWFVSSDGLLVLGGRDATSNEVVVKRHMQPGDVFVHADIHGAPAVVIKTEGKSVSDATIQEAFDFAASYSKAWKHGVYGLDVYWVKPEQVSKTTEHGEYVGKGAFIIRGKKNFGKGGVQLAMGVKVDEEANVVGGPATPVEKQSDYAVRITPGRKSSSEIAKEIKTRLAQLAGAGDKEKILRLPIEDIQAFLPSGGSEILKK